MQALYFYAAIYLISKIMAVLGNIVKVFSAIISLSVITSLALNRVGIIWANLFKSKVTEFVLLLSKTITFCLSLYLK